MERGNRANLDERVALEGLLRLLGVGILRGDLESRKNLPNFPQLVRVMRSDVDLHGNSPSIWT